MNVHVSGVGALGAFLLWELRAHEVDFTWDDCETPWNAWEASTGSISPYPERQTSRLAEGYRVWANAASLRPEFRRDLEAVGVLYALKQAPARARHATELRPLGAGLKLWQDDRVGWQLNVQEFVTRTRRAFHAYRLEAEPEAAEYPGLMRVRCWGISHQDSAIAQWGWQLPVELAEPLVLPGTTQRAALHFTDPARPRGSLYLYPIPGFPEYWWAGSEAVWQAQPHDARAKAEAGVARLKARVEDVFGEGWVRKYHEDNLAQGWRPARRRHWPDAACARTAPREYVALPLGQNGIQCGPLVAHEIVTALQEEEDQA